MISLIFFFVFLITLFIYINRVIKPLLAEHNLDTKYISKTKVSFYFDADAVMKFLKRLVKEAKDEEKKRLQGIHRNYFGLNVLALIAAIRAMIEMANF